MWENPPHTEMHRKNVGLRVRYLLISLVISAVLAVPVYLYYYNTQRILVDREATNARNLAITMATLVEESIDDYRALVSAPAYEPGTYDEAYYQRMNELFRYIKGSTDANFIFTERLSPDKSDMTQYILDAEVPGSVDFSPIGTEDTLGEIEMDAFRESRPLSTGMLNDPNWGDYITGFAPITDPVNGENLGLVGVDYSGKHVLELMRGVQIIVIWTQISLFILVMAFMNTAVHTRLQSYRIDPLTGLLNKSNFEEILHHAIPELKRGGRSACVAMMDIDNFKQINDTYGHADGDKVLARAGSIVRSCVRRTDMASRFGGDEFLIFFWDTKAEHAEVICKRIRSRMQDETVLMDNGATVSISLSIGIAEWTKSMTEQDMLKAADRAMYMAKSKGKNAIVIGAPLPHI